jgi:glycosyltransferase involved in cell wall biosynthesis
LIVPALDPDAWARALIRVLSDSRLAADLVARGRRVAADQSWDRAADRTLRLVENVCAGRAERR